MNEQFTTPAQVGLSAASRLATPTRTASRSQLLSQWKSVAQSARALTGLRDGSQATKDQLNALKSGGFLCISNPHPFKIYNVPSVCISAPNPSTDWLTYRVRSGSVGDIDVDGTDDVDNPDSDEVPLSTGNITVTSAEAQFEFWIELTNPGSVKTATIKYGADPTTNGWADFPDTDGRFIRIGWVDTTDTTNKQGIVRQILRADVPKGIGMFDCSGDSSDLSTYEGYKYPDPS